MLDRVPTKPNRYAVYDDAHNFLRYEYHERADEPTQEGDALNKANLLPDAVATALGLTGNPQVKDALAKLSSSINTLQYVWNKFSYSYTYETAASITLTSNDNQSITKTIQYSDTFSYYNGMFTLQSPQTVIVGYSATFDSGVLDGKYFINGDTPTSTILYKGAGDIVKAYSNSYYSTSVVCQKLDATEALVGQVFSYDSAAHSDGVEADGYGYTYIGRPQYIGARISTGSYTGTGTYGSGNPNSLTLDFAPKRISIINSTGIVFGELIINGTTVYGYSYSGSFVALVGSISGNTISWYNATNAAKQLNASGVAYLYVAEG